MTAIEAWFIGTDHERLRTEQVAEDGESIADRRLADRYCELRFRGARLVMPGLGEVQLRDSAGYLLGWWPNETTERAHG